LKTKAWPLLEIFMKQRTKWSVGDWVEVRSKEEILKTLDSDGRIDGMPFMPEMFQYCGKKFQVFKRAHKTCDPDWGSRRIPGAVHLETRCDGSAHGGCQAGCLIFWKDEWLKPASTGSARAPELAAITSNNGKCTESVVADRAIVLEADGSTSYMCQTTQVQHETPIAWWDIRQYLEDYWSGNINLKRLFSGTIYSLYFMLTNAGFGGPTLRRIYDKARPLWRGVAWPRKPGLIPAGEQTPTIDLNLQPGEMVRVKSHEEILKTVNTHSKNRGLWWDAELVPYCGGTYRVHSRVNKVLDEKTGKMQVMKNPSIILDNVVCQARYSACRMFCPRNTYAYWREIWLQRVDPQAPGSGS
jgi:hypothetical protein